MDINPPFVLSATKYVTIACLSVIPLAVPVNQGKKSEKFNRIEFKCWQQKMFYLTTFNLARFLNESVPVLTEEATTTKSVAAVDAWNHADFLCQNLSSINFLST